MPIPPLHHLAPAGSRPEPFASVRVGCAGWTVPKQSAASFPAEGSHLERYAGVFGAVEINSAFYKPHRPATYARWAASTPDDFRFSVKMPRAATHDGRLQEPEAVLDRFAGEASALGNKLEWILTQVPPKLDFDEGVADAYFTALRQRFACRLACEARHPSWFGATATALLSTHGISRVIADPAAGQPGPHDPTAAAMYVRLHGSPRVYYGSYDDDELRKAGAALAAQVAVGRPVWCIFDNTLSPGFVDQALLLQRSAQIG